MAQTTEVWHTQAPPQEEEGGGAGEGPRPARVLHLLQHLRQRLQDAQAAGLHAHLLPGVPDAAHGHGGRGRDLLPLLPPAHRRAAERAAGAGHQPGGAVQAAHAPAAGGERVAGGRAAVLQAAAQPGEPGLLRLHRHRRRQAGRPRRAGGPGRAGGGARWPGCPTGSGWCSSWC
ncbi:hypothetical protein ANANG_G00227510 [Anguilla anguilla]|uniref:Uncharacterized protein n=1 Tax=Anguilla anguilla TaxID=7936 RepID=A0A9D3LYQ2_ANGAN|nr:hypothetical protein ANANG_G00227510 [Anguilla anguilla]